VIFKELNTGTVDKTRYRPLFQGQKKALLIMWRGSILLFRLLISVIFYSTGDKQFPVAKDDSIEWSRRRLDGNKVQMYRCLHLDEDKASPNSDRKDFTKTRESICGILFYCYVFFLFFFGSNVSAA